MGRSGNLELQGFGTPNHSGLATHSIIHPRNTQTCTALQMTRSHQCLAATRISPYTTSHKVAFSLLNRATTPLNPKP